ncbi:protein phosphatase 2C domain-containing protein [Phenylobacterium montanum]|uniref:Protein phosphatase 2C domain-containing protein n=1 Tax=Phenylobacterium montanum TaxID=2823693 RepID=A0A975IV17_9CAUL|nr:protein phosphatase 2C domain-containing protein [Caulobacter sp. S6]QUD88383.1 protein phosphatase 2C domain-containing protein [Caulobacter sp. S6]
MPSVNPTFEILDSLTAPGNPDRPNDDAWCVAGQLAAVIDGATGLGGALLPGESDAAWLAHRAAERLTVRTGLGDARSALAAVAADLESDFLRERIRPPVEMYETPLASLMLLGARGDAWLDALWFGDCCALVQRPGEALQIVGHAFDGKTGEAQRAARHGRESGAGPAAKANWEQMLPALREHRNRLNQPSGRWVLAPDARCAEMAQSAEIAAPAGTVILLASDGFLALSSDYGRYDPADLVAAAHEQGLAPLLAELRAIEQADPDGLTYPRYKTSDDATAVLLRVL